MLLGLQQPLGSGDSFPAGAGHYLQEDRVEGDYLSTGDGLAQSLRLG